MAYLAQAPHSGRDGRVDVRSTSKIISRNHTHGMRSPGSVHGILSYPLAGTEGTDNHEQSTDELLAKGLEVFSFANVGRKKRHDHTGWHELHEGAQIVSEVLNDCLDHGRGRMG